MIEKKEVTLRENLTLDQSPEILQKILSRNPPPGGNFVQIIYMTNVAPDGTQKMTEAEVMKTLLVRLPDPKLKNLQDLAYEVALGKFSGNKHKAGLWLGVSGRQMYLKEEKHESLDGDRG